MVKTIEAYVCDRSGVISHDSPPVYEANMMLLGDFGRARISFEEWKSLTGLTPAGFLRNCRIVAGEARTYEKYKAYYNQIVKSGNLPEIVPGAREALEELRRRGERLILLSSHPYQNLREEMKRYGIDGLFEIVIGSVTDKVSGLKNIREKLGLNGRTLYIGDTIYDVKASKGAGFLSCAVPTKYAYHSRKRLEAENPDFTIGELNWVLGI